MIGGTGTGSIGAGKGIGMTMAGLKFLAAIAALSVAPAAWAQKSSLRPIDPFKWITNNDYPMESLRRREQGMVYFRLDVDEKGKVSACTITQTSGFRRLDDTVCAALKARARFIPARNEEGQNIPSVWSSRFHWEIP
ncbi:energy transducer TonB [Sphingomonas sp. AOB5]|uniref:energy transducer TonB n=1 Tax=Sphingomonas sp. AOB5 TaxID=3034017 RepID=UPI0023F73AEB|nr:energy transducer TonB [Sphingomonas sp. AOB5]MDF7773917.1 energy transducer TonB [Sphingomonas sp. AOB5]